MNIGVEMLSANIGMSIEMVILLVLVAGSMIFMAIKFEVGAIMLFITSGITFILEYIVHWNYTPALVVMFLSLILMSISLLWQGKTAGVVG